jgi:hypothetical protein
MDEQQIRALVSERGSMMLSELLAFAKPADKPLVELRVLHMAKRGTLRGPSSQRCRWAERLGARGFGTALTC